MSFLKKKAKCDFLKIYKPNKKTLRIDVIFDGRFTG